jgi:hypothetical protein
MADIFETFDKNLYRLYTAVYQTDALSDVTAVPATTIPDINSIIDPGQGASGPSVGNVEMVNGALQSGDFQAGVQGWQIKANGDVEFNAGTFRGDVNIGSPTGAEVVISGNDINLYDVTTGGGGTITGDTASIDFIRRDGNPGTFVIQKRHSKNNNLGNVEEMFYSAAASAESNYLFIGRSGLGNNAVNYTDVVDLHAVQDMRVEINRVHDYDSRPSLLIADIYKENGGGSLQGVHSILASEGNDGIFVLGHNAEILTFSNNPNFKVGDTITGNVTGATAKISIVAGGGTFYSNHTSYGVNFSASDNACTTNGVGGGSGTGVYVMPNPINTRYGYLGLLYSDSSLNVRLGNPFLPDSDNSYDIGSNSFRIKDLYVGGTIHGGITTGISMTALESGSLGDLMCIAYFPDFATTTQTDTFGGSSTFFHRTAIGMVGNGVSMSSMFVKMIKNGSPTNNVVVRIETDSAGAPSGSLVNANATSTIAAASVSGILGSLQITFGGAFTIANGTKCWIVFNVDATYSDTNYYGVGTFGTGSQNACSPITLYTSSWQTTTYSEGFYLTSAAGLYTSGVFKNRATGNSLVSKAIGLAKANYSAGDTLQIAGIGQVITGMSGLVPGKYYPPLTATPGALGTATTIQADGQVGMAITDTSMYIFLHQIAGN